MISQRISIYNNIYLITDPDNITDTCGVDTISPS